MDPALKAARHVASALPWTMSASGAEIGSQDGFGHSWRSVRPGGGVTPGGKVADGPMMMEILLRSISAMSGRD
jgi:hypothetical protein